MTKLTKAEASLRRAIRKAIKAVEPYAGERNNCLGAYEACDTANSILKAALSPSKPGAET